MEGADFAKNMMAHTLTFHHSHTETWMTYTHSLKVIHVSAQIFNICLHLDLMIPYQILHQVDPSSGGPFIRWTLHQVDTTSHNPLMVNPSFKVSMAKPSSLENIGSRSLFLLPSAKYACNVKMMTGM